MPYRRRPNTNQARLRTLRKAVREAGRQHFGKPVISYKTLHEATSFLTLFEKQLILYNQSLENQIKANEKYAQIISNVRTYLSHFIQVFNLSVIRGDIKKEHKEYYHLHPETHNVPDLSTEANLLLWGKNIINGEKNRLRMEGGTPIYNPTIAKVQVHFEVFKSYKAEQKLYQTTTQRNRDELVKLRDRADAIILDIWNQVETYFQEEEPAEKRIKLCKTYGIIYYYRPNEKKE